MIVCFFIKDVDVMDTEQTLEGKVNLIIIKSFYLIFEIFILR